MSVKIFDVNDPENIEYFFKSGKKKENDALNKYREKF